MESYSRVLESLAFNIVARIDDLVFVDDMAKHSDRLAPLSKFGVSQKSISVPYSVQTSSTPSKSASTTSIFSPAPLIGPTKGEIFNLHTTVESLGLGMKKVWTDNRSGDTQNKESGNALKESHSVSNATQEVSPYHTEEESFKCIKSVTLPVQESVVEE